MNFKVENVGQFKEAAVEFGDLTLLVGAQGTGKSIFLQLFKLSQDRGYIKTTMSEFGQDWNWESKAELMEAYFGEGMGYIYDEDKSHILRKLAPGEPEAWLSRYDIHSETVYYIPAQRVLTMLTGWPQPYRGYASHDPFVVKNFSEHIRRYLENLKDRETLFPIAQKIKKTIRDVLDATIFHGASVSRAATAGQKQVRLNVDGDENRAISYMAWSTGQREFLPLLLGCYELLPTLQEVKRNTIEWVVIEEPEMGLHPMGIFAVMALVLDILSRGYKVVISTHSSNVLDIVWAMEEIKEQKIDDAQKIALVAKLLDLPSDDVEMSEIIGEALRLAFKTHCFYYGEDGYVHTKDISSLDPGDEDELIAGWGGLATYSARVSDVVAEAVRTSWDE